MKKNVISLKIPILRAWVTPRPFKHWKKKLEGKKKGYFKKQSTYNEWTPVVFPIFVLEENVNDCGRQGVEEGKDSNSDEELC